MILRWIFALALAAMPSLTAHAQDRRVPASAADVRLSYAPVVNKVTPSVVNVYAARIVQNRNPLMDDPFFRRFFGGGGRAMPRSRCSARSARAWSWTLPA